VSPTTTLPSATLPATDPDDMLATLVKPRLAWAQLHEQARKIAERNAERRERERECAIAQRRARNALGRLSGYVTVYGQEVSRRLLWAVALFPALLALSVAALLLS
jgi:hypothetical protein